MTGAIRGTSNKTYYEELGLKSLHYGRLYRKPSYFYKFYKHELPQYLSKLMPVREYSARSMQNYPFFKTWHNYQKCFFLSPIIKWSKELNIRTSTSLNIFRNSILNFIRPSANSVFNSHNPKVIKFITRLRLVLSHLQEHNFKHSFQYLLNLIYNYGFDI